ncbi:MAG: flagellar hook-basal body complex protein FliE [Actinomycetota bacterium]|nr:flagellar hook-basal body complex protein FliE [Actinomycetota bacterium]
MSLPVGAISPTAGVNAILSAADGAAPDGPSRIPAVDFGNLLSSVEASLIDADQAAQDLATGEITDIHDFTTAASKARLSVELTAAVRNQALEAFQEIMRMQI